MYVLLEQGKELQAMVRDFCQKEVVEFAKKYDKGEETDENLMALYRKAFDMGLHTLEIPEEFGGMGIDLVEAAALYEEMAIADAGFATALSATCLALKPVLIAGTPEQIKLFSDIIIPGNFGAFCLTEPNAGSDAANTKSTAVKDGDEYVINGSKCFITNGGWASVYVVFAMTDKTKGTKGISAFIVERDRPGVSVGKHEDKMGIRLSNTCDVIFEDVRVPASHLLGKEGEGFKIAMMTLDASRPFVGICATGIAQRALNEAVAYSKERITFGKPICKNQALQFMMADMAIKIETARQMCCHAISLYRDHLPFSKEAAIAKCYAGDIAVEVASDGIQILGGYGYSREYPAEKLLRDAKIFQIFEGTNQIQRVVISGQVLK